jgi:hypothetical protein
MQVVAYSPEWEKGWNKLIKESKNGTFLINRNYMEYHKDHFQDCSLIFSEGDKMLGVLPANWDEEDKTIYSHQGLTYGGLILHTEVKAVQVMQMIDESIELYREKYHATRMIYKPVPYIYHRYPAQEDLYGIFRHNCKLYTRGLSSTIPLTHPLGMKESRKSGVRKAISNSLYLSKTSDVEPFWHILNYVLTTYHNTCPVHTPDELNLLMSRFPKEIQLFVVKDQEEVVAGCLLFIMPQVVHVQYIAASDKGKEYGALDLLFHYLINEKFKDISYLDFGVSTENGGLILNEGLEFQKEGFGGRGVCYDSYEIIF